MIGSFLDELTKLAAVSVPMGRISPVSVDAPQKKRKKFPFQGFVNFQGLEIHIENKKGSYREGKGKDGKPWRTYMHHHYGEIEATRGADGDALDAYVGPDAHSPLVVVVHQQKPDTKEYDEDKVMLGFRSIPEALKAYRGQYDKPGFYGGHTAMPIGSLLAWCEDKKRQGKRVKLAKQDKTDRRLQMLQYGAGLGAAALFGKNLYREISRSKGMGKGMTMWDAGLQGGAIGTAAGAHEIRKQRNKMRLQGEESQ